MPFSTNYSWFLVAFQFFIAGWTTFHCLRSREPVLNIWLDASFLVVTAGFLPTKSVSFANFLAAATITIAMNVGLQILRLNEFAPKLQNWFSATTLSSMFLFILGLAPEIENQVTHGLSRLTVIALCLSIYAGLTVPKKIVNIAPIYAAASLIFMIFF